MKRLALASELLHQCQGVTKMADDRWGATPQHAFLAVAEDADSTVMTCTEARIQEIDRSGCYVNTPNTFPESTPLTLYIFGDDEMSVRKGKIVYVHDRIGMAIAFENQSQIDQVGQGQPPKPH
jgi:hypothetical protein